MSYLLVCKSCGYERLITVEWLESLKIKLSPSQPFKIKNYLHLLRCSKCSAKTVTLQLDKISESKTSKPPKADSRPKKQKFFAQKPKLLEKHDLEDKIDDHIKIQDYGSVVFHRDKRYSGITDGTTKLKHLFEDDNNEQELRVRVYGGGIKIASPKKLDFIRVANSSEYQQPTTRNKGRENFCYECHNAVGYPDKKCNDCKWYICSQCGSCKCNYIRRKRYR